MQLQHVTYLVGWQGAGGPKHSLEGGQGTRMPWDLPVPLHLKHLEHFTNTVHKATWHFSTGMVVTQVFLVILVNICHCTKLLSTLQSHFVNSCMLAASPLACHAIIHCRSLP